MQMQAVRRTLTELLLDVTNNIINEVAKDTLKQMRLKGIVSSSSLA